MAELLGLRVLVLEDDTDGRELLEFFLGRLGVNVRSACTVAEARAILLDWPAEVILADIRMPGEDGISFITQLRASPATAHIPAIALSAHAEESWRKRALEAGFKKFIAKPFEVFTLPAAIVSVALPRSTSRDELGGAPRIARLIAERDMRALLTVLNEPTPYRYTSILCCSEGALESVWTFDREHDGVDAFPATRLEASYCVLVEATRAAFVLADSFDEPRVSTHPKRDALRSYCGVPLLRGDGTVFGTLCHYDAEPHPVDEATVETLETVARMLTPTLPKSERPLSSDRTGAVIEPRRD